MISLLLAASAFGQFGAPAGPISVGSAVAARFCPGGQGRHSRVRSPQRRRPLRARRTASTPSIRPVQGAQGPHRGAALRVLRSKAEILRQADACAEARLDRGLGYNLGAVGLSLRQWRQAHGQTLVASARSSLMPNINGTLSETVEQINLRADGLRISSPIPGFGISLHRPGRLTFSICARGSRRPWQI